MIYCQTSSFLSSFNCTLMPKCEYFFLLPQMEAILKLKIAADFFSNIFQSVAFIKVLSCIKIYIYIITVYITKTMNFDMLK